MRLAVGPFDALCRKGCFCTQLPARWTNAGPGHHLRRVHVPRRQHSPPLRLFEVPHAGCQHIAHNRAGNWSRLDNSCVKCWLGSFRSLTSTLHACPLCLQVPHARNERCCKPAHGVRAKPSLFCMPLWAAVGSHQLRRRFGARLRRSRKPSNRAPLVHSLLRQDIRPGMAKAFALPSRTVRHTALKWHDQFNQTNKTPNTDMAGGHFSETIIQHWSPYFGLLASLETSRNKARSVFFN